MSPRPTSDLEKLVYVLICFSIFSSGFLLIRFATRDIAKGEKKIEEKYSPRKFSFINFIFPLNKPFRKSAVEKMKNRQGEGRN